MAIINRRNLLARTAGSVIASALPTGVALASDSDFFRQLADRARRMAGQPYRPPAQTSATVLKDLTPEEFSTIRFSPDRALWSGSDGYEVWFLKPGVYANELIAINELKADGSVMTVNYDPAAFSADGLTDDGATVDAGGFNGFKVLYPLHPQNDWKDELIVFRGASYFRFLGRDQWYGLSARGLAIDPGGEKPEEFPLFREFWLQQPAEPDCPLTVYALLDSPSVSGAYRFDIRPGDDTEIGVTASLYPRKRIERLGIAPLTSMFIRDRDSLGYEDTGAIHDSDGLAVQTGTGEWIWRPLVKRKWPAYASFEDRAPHGFGLFQRNRNADDYASPDFNYHMRPGYWVEPAGDWGKGAVELVEFQNGDVNFDNIVAYWRPAEPARPGSEIALSYTLTATKSVPGWAAGGHVAAERVEAIDKDLNNPYLDIRIDFQGSRLIGSEGIGENIDAVVTARDGDADTPVVTVDENTGRVRVRTRIRNIDTDTTELRAYLKRGDDVLTETWSYLWIA
ncbi:MAG: glucan biosynthesis protein [Alphaproteobacteria bacterium]